MTKTLALRWMLIVLSFQTLAVCQRWIDIAPEKTTFRSFNGSGPPPPAGTSWSWYLPFPDSHAGITDSACSSIAHPSFRWWRFAPYAPADQTEVWAEQLTGDFVRHPGSLFITDLYSNIRGISFQGVLGGRLESNSNLKWNNLVQAVYYHKNYCYDGGPEFGFMRVLINPADISQLTRLYFYQSVNTNCDEAAGGMRTLPLLAPTGSPTAHGICEYAATGEAIQARVKMTEIRIEHDTLYNYTAYLMDAVKFRVEIRKVADDTCAFCSHVGVADFFAGDASQMLNGHQPGFITMTMQKSMARDAAGHFFGSLTSPPWDYAAIGINRLKVLE